METSRLSDLTPAVVDHLYGIDSAVPTMDPTFVFLVGSPGVGKSSGHEIAKAKGYLPADTRAYATVNLDTLLESVTPFRAGSALGHILKHRHGVKVDTIHAYQSKKENMGAFNTYNTVHDDLVAKNANMIRRLNTVRERFLPLKDVPVAKNLLTINDEAIERAIKKSIPIVYETTLTYTKRARRVEKFEKIKSWIEEFNPRYKIVILHLLGEPAEIAERIDRRQEYVMPFGDKPYYRVVPTFLVDKFVAGTAEAVRELKAMYADKFIFDEYTVKMNAAMLPPKRNINTNAAAARIMNAYGAVSYNRTLRRPRPNGLNNSNSYRKTMSKRRRPENKSNRT